jgi:hypothetical protein
MSVLGPDFELLRHALETARRDAAELVQDAEAAAVTWIWTKFDPVRRSPRLFERERGAWPAARLIEPPDRPLGVETYGYDSRGRLRAGHIYGDAAGDVRPFVCAYEDNRIWRFEFGPERIPLRVGLTRLSERVPIYAARYGEDAPGGPWNWSEESYAWEGGRVAEIVGRQDSSNSPEPERLRMRTWTTLHLKYDQVGELAEMVAITPGREPVLMYQPPAANRSPTTVVRAFGQATAKAFELVLAAESLERFGAVCLLYDTEEPVAPTLHACPADSFGELVATDPLAFEVLNPADWPDAQELILPWAAVGVDLDATARAVSIDELERDVIERLRAATRRVARINIRQQCVIYACDLHLDDLEQNLRDVLPKRSALRQRLGI